METRVPRTDGFHPAWWLPGRHLETIVPALLPSFPLSGRRESLLVQVASGVQVRLEIDRPAAAPGAPCCWCMAWGIGPIGLHAAHRAPGP